MTLALAGLAKVLALQVAQASVVGTVRDAETARPLDRPAPRLEATDVIHGSGRGLAWGRRAALVVLGLGLAGVAYAAPGSPVPAWLRAITAEMRPTPAPPVSAPAAPIHNGDSAASGIAVSPGERLTVTLPSPAAGALAYVSLGDSTDLAVRVVSGTASFSSGMDRLAVETFDSSAVFRIVVPRGGPWIEIRAGGVRLFLKRGARITAAVEPSPQGVYLLRVAPRRP
jgi:hypothetical protein